MIRKGISSLLLANTSPSRLSIISTQSISYKKASLYLSPPIHHIPYHLVPSHLAQNLKLSRTTMHLHSSHDIIQEASLRPSTLLHHLLAKLINIHRDTVMQSIILPVPIVYLIDIYTLVVERQVLQE
jgi:hypothetical protein